MSPTAARVRTVLRAAGIMVSPASTRRTREGIRVTARDSTSCWVTADFDGPSEAARTAKALADLLNERGGWKATLDEPGSILVTAV